MDYCFDTSALNDLYGDPQREKIVSNLLAKHQVLVTALNIREAVATQDPVRRVELLKFQRRLTAELRPLRTPIELLKTVTEAHLKGVNSVAVTIEENSQGLWWALETPEGLTQKLQQESYVWKKNLENQFTAAHRKARIELKKVFSPTFKPTSFGKLLKLFGKYPNMILPTVSGIYKTMTNESLDMQGLVALFSILPEWPLYMLGWAQGMYARALRDEGHGHRKNAGTIDLWFAVYLAHCDCLVTADYAQYKALRVINLIGPRRRNRATVLLYDRFKKDILR